LKSAPLGVKAELKKIFSICPKLLINAELYGLVLAPWLEKQIPSNLGGQFATLGANVSAFINIQQWRRSRKRKDRMKLSLPPKLVEKLVWVPIILICKIFIPTLRL
jgi:hypothetical protein